MIRSYGSVVERQNSTVARREKNKAPDRRLNEKL
jgi:hypothetical protein